MNLRRILSRTHSNAADLTQRRQTPWISSPLEQKGQSATNSAHIAPNLNRTGPLEFDESHVTNGSSKLPPFKHHRESSTIELFYDLFFVANLTTFTVNHEIVDGKSLKNYLGFFTLLWFTWLETSLLDVRFASDSFFDRVCKAISFGVMTGFAIVGSLYDTTDVEEDLKAFRAMSFILMVSRLALIAQYAVVLWYVKGYRNTLVPLLSTMGTLFVSALVFLGTFWGFRSVRSASEDGRATIQHPDTYLAWYIVVVCEAAAIIVISCVWRVVSFKRTHLVERIGLLTLIIMGEGIIGMTKSVSSILKFSASVTSGDIGVVAAAVLLIYFFWVLYFDQIEHDRFGTIRQQVWAILHFPLHVAILLTVEGSTALILWNIIQRFIITWLTAMTYLDNPITLATFNSTEEIQQYTEDAIHALGDLFRITSIDEIYVNWQDHVAAIGNISAPFRSAEWSTSFQQVLRDIELGGVNAIFINFDVEIAETHEDSEVAEVTAAGDRFNTVFIYFYISAGAFLLVLGMLYWFGKTRKTRGEWLSILLRTIFGLGIVAFCATTFVNSDAAQNFTFSSWPVVVVGIGYFIVIMADNLLVWHTNQTIAKQTSHNPAQHYDVEAAAVDRSNNKAGHADTEDVVPAARANT